MWAPTEEQIQSEITAYQGSWLDQAPHRSILSIIIQTMAFLFENLWRVSGQMLIGMALFKLGVISAKRSVTFYIVMLGFTATIGLPIILYGVQYNLDAEWAYEQCQFGGKIYNYVGSVFLALAWIALVMLVCKTKALELITKPFAAVGRMAFTNYIMQTVICTTIFYGHGFGLFGEVERTGQLLIVIAVWIFQLIVSPIWLTYFRFGPLEWAWRCLSYWKRQPMLRTNS
jgi:uncharacterized protein